MTATRDLHPPPATLSIRGFDVERMRQDFPILASQVNGHPLVYLDTAATCQRPTPVLRAMSEFDRRDNANVHRGLHELSRRATEAYDAARERVRRFLRASHDAEIVFTSGTTAGINLVAQSYGRSVLRPGDEIVLTEMEHHSNLVPWQLVRDATGAVIRVVPVTEEGELRLDDYEALLSPRTKIVAVAHASNVLGTVNPIRRMARAAHERGAVVVVDGAQAAPHLDIDVQDLECDFYVGSGHKMYGPMGVGFLYGRLDLLERMPPWQGGGGMIASVTFERTTYAPPPARFEAGTPPVAQAVGLAAAIDYLGSLDGSTLVAHESDLLNYATERIGGMRGLRIIGRSDAKVAVLSFDVNGVHPHDVGTILDAQGIAVRAGHHCAQPLMQRFGLAGTVRASFGLYNTRQDVDALADGLEEVRAVLG